MSRDDATLVDLAGADYSGFPGHDGPPGAEAVLRGLVSGAGAAELVLGGGSSSQRIQREVRV